MSFEELKREALKLSYEEKRELAESLYQGLEQEEESALPAEVRRRDQAYREGKTKPISLDELRARLA